MTRRTVLVTGASGAIGRRVVRELRARGWRTRALVHRRDPPEVDERANGSLADRAALDRAVDGATAVLHLAGVTHSRDPKAYEGINAEGTATLAAAAASANIERFVHVSTRAASVSGGQYSLSKLRAEETVSRSALEHVIVRLAEVYGAGGNEGVDRIIRATRRGSLVPLVGNGSEVICPIYVDDVVDAIAGALEAPTASGKTYTVGGDCIAISAFVAECKRVFESRSRTVKIPIAAVEVAGVASRWLPLPLYPDQLARLRSPKEAPTPVAESVLGFR